MVKMVVMVKRMDHRLDHGMVGDGRSGRGALIGPPSDHPTILQQLSRSAKEMFGATIFLTINPDRYPWDCRPTGLPPPMPAPAGCPPGAPRSPLDALQRWTHREGFPDTETPGRGCKERRWVLASDGQVWGKGQAEGSTGSARPCSAGHASPCARPPLAHSTTPPKPGRHGSPGSSTGSRACPRYGAPTGSTRQG
jgi:hypothetical protein